VKTSLRQASSTKSIQHTLQTLRYKLFAKAAYITTKSRKSTTFEKPVEFKPIYAP
jgi:hypothetical protein